MSVIDRAASLREVRRVVKGRAKRQRKRVTLVLSCGHTKLHDPRVSVPRRSYCVVC